MCGVRHELARLGGGAVVVPPSRRAQASRWQYPAARSVAGNADLERLMPDVAFGAAAACQEYAARRPERGSETDDAEPHLLVETLGGRFCLRVFAGRMAVRQLPGACLRLCQEPLAGACA